MAYLFSYPFSSAASGFAILALFNIVAGKVLILDIILNSFFIFYFI